MHFMKAIAIFIARIFTHRMIDGLMLIDPRLGNAALGSPAILGGDVGFLIFTLSSLVVSYRAVSAHECLLAPSR
jgi:hypothetical protein